MPAPRALAKPKFGDPSIKRNGARPPITEKVHSGPVLVRERIPTWFQQFPRSICTSTYSGKPLTRQKYPCFVSMR